MAEIIKLKFPDIFIIFSFNNIPPLFGGTFRKEKRMRQKAPE